MAKLYTEEQQEHVAVDKFKEILGNSNMWFNSRTFPTSESDDDAFIKCSDSEKGEGILPQALGSYAKMDGEHQRRT